MKRDLDLIRSILKQTEAQPHGFSSDLAEAFPGHTGEEVGFHVHLMGQAGLLVVADNTTLSHSSPSAMPISITWDGYEFLKAAANDNLWAKAKKHFIKPGAEAAFSVLLAWLKAEAKKEFGLPP